MSPTGPPTAGSVMTTDLLTVGPAERLDLAALMMDRRAIRQLLVVDPDGRLLGIVSYRALIQLLSARRAAEIEGGGLVREFMEPDPVTVSPTTPLRDVIRLMLEEEVSAVPVVDEGSVVGIVSEHDVVRVAGGLLERSPMDSSPT